MDLAPDASMAATVTLPSRAASLPPSPAAIPDPEAVSRARSRRRRQGHRAETGSSIAESSAPPVAVVPMALPLEARLDDRVAPRTADVAIALRDPAGARRLSVGRRRRRGARGGALCGVGGYALGLEHRPPPVSVVAAPSPPPAIIPSGTDVPVTPAPAPPTAAAVGRDQSATPPSPPSEPLPGEVSKPPAASADHSRAAAPSASHAKGESATLGAVGHRQSSRGRARLRRRTCRRRHAAHVSESFAGRVRIPWVTRP